MINNNNNNPENNIDKNSNNNNPENNIDKNSNNNNNLNENPNNNIEIKNIKDNNIDKNSNNNINENTSDIEKSIEIKEIDYEDFVVDKQFNIHLKIYPKGDKSNANCVIMRIYQKNNEWHYSFQDAETKELKSYNDMDKKHAKILDAIKNNACGQTEANKTNLDVTNINKEDRDKINNIIHEIGDSFLSQEKAGKMNNNVPTSNIKESYSEDFIKSQSEGKLFD